MNKGVKTDLGSKEIFSRNFNRYLEASGKLGTDVARYVGVSSGTISDWKFGRAYPRMDKVQLIAEFFGIQKSDLVNDVTVVKEVISDEDQKVLDKFHQVPKEKREFVLSMIQAVIDTL